MADDPMKFESPDGNIEAEVPFNSVLYVEAKDIVRGLRSDDDVMRFILEVLQEQGSEELLGRLRQWLGSGEDTTV